VFRLAKALVCLLLAAAAAQAQLTTPHVNVLITGADCGKLHSVFLVIDDDDSKDEWIPLDNAGNCRWTANLGERTLSTRLSHFSLRIDSGRTDCHRAAVDEEQHAARLQFACCSESRKGPLRDVRVTTKPPMPVSYVRDVPKDPDTRTDGIKCIEMAAFRAGTGEIRHTQFSAEDVYLQLGVLKPQRQPFGLLLDDVVAHAGTLVLTRDGVTYRLIVQRARGKGGSSPTFSSNAISIDVKKLGELKLERAEFEVIK